MSMKYKALLISIFILTATLAKSQLPLSSPVFLISTGEQREGRPVVEFLPTEDANYQKARQLFDRGFVNHVVALYKMAQQLQVTHGLKPIVDDAYLVFTEEEQVAAQTGFWLKTASGLTDKPETGYVTMPLASLNTKRDEIAAPPQLFNREMGHLILNVLTINHHNSHVHFSPLKHYFTAPTDYFTAFDEGFAAHLQYLTVEFERTEKIKDTINSHLRKLKSSLPKIMFGYERDYTLPMRMGFFAATMPLWYEKIENVKRYTFIKNNWAKMPARVAKGISHPRDYIHYRNASVWPTPATSLTFEQAASTEGVIAAFLTNMVMNDIGKNYFTEQFYREFIPDTSIEVPRQVDVTTNQYLKIFKIIAGSVTLSPTPTCPVADFVNAYVKAMPHETTYIMSCWETAAGVSFKTQPAPELWVMNQRFDFLPHATAPYGPTLSPYPFNLNIADTFDLMTFGLNRVEAEKILAWRTQRNGFRKLAEVEATPGVEASKLSTIAKSPYDFTIAQQQYAGATISETSNWLFTGLHLLKMVLFWYIILGIGYAIALYKVADVTPTPLRMGYFLLKILIFTLATLLFLIIGFKPFGLTLVMMALTMAASYLLFRKDKAKLKVSLGFTFLIGMLMLYSIY